MKELIIKVDEEKMDIEGNAPVVDRPQELVRCKDCRYGEPVKNGAGDDCIQCNNDDLWWEGMLHFPDWFCADGERKEV